MSEIVTKAVSFIILIALGYILKKCGILQKEDRHSILNLVFYITLPCILISSFKTFEYSSSLIIPLLIGIAANFIVLGFGYVASIKSKLSFRKSSMMVPTGFAIGTFTIPFASTFLGPESLIIIAIFDMGQAFMGLGGTYTAVANITGFSSTIRFRDIVIKLFSSPPFATYLIMLGINVLGFTLPEKIYVFTDLAGSTTSFLVMIVIGLMLEINITKESMAEVVKLLAIRYAATIAMAVTIFYIVPLQIEFRLALVICMFSPPSASSVIFSQKLGCNPIVISAVQSITIPISLLLSCLLILLSQSFT